MAAEEESLGGLPIRPGDLLLKKYRVERLIGQGGTAIVLSATHVQLQQRVAIKFLKPALDSDELRARFEREARAMEKIESEHVVVIVDAGTLDDGAPFMVMEYLEGRDLARVLGEDGPMPVQTAVDCMVQVCEALGHAHALGIVHRDLKPANLFLTKRDGGVHVKVVDFGISKMLDHKIFDPKANPREFTGSFTMLGSPRYMAPEQMRNSKDVDPRADLWSVGAVLFQLMTGEHAFEGESNVQACLAAISRPPRRARLVAPHVPEELEVVIQKCLTKDMNDRYQSAAELSEALRPFASEYARDSLDRIEHARQSPSVEIAVGIAPSSKPPHNLPRATTVEPVMVPAVTSTTSTEDAQPPSRLSLLGLGVGTFLVVFSVLMGVRRLTETPRPAARFAAESAVPAILSAVPLDAGKASP